MPDMSSVAEQCRQPRSAAAASSWVERLQLTDFRNYASLTLERRPAAGGADGPNGSGKTNLLEALSLLDLGPGAAPRALSGAGRASATRAGRWPRTCARPHGAVDIGTGGSGRVGDQRAQRPHRAHRRRGPDGLRRAGRLCRDGLADAGHGWAVHRPRIRAPALPRPPDRLLRSRLPRARSDSSSAPCSSATACWPTTCASRALRTASSASWRRPGSPSPRRAAAAVAELQAAIDGAPAAPARSAFPWAELALVRHARGGLGDAPGRRRRGRLPRGAGRRARARPRGGPNAGGAASLRSGGRPRAQGDAGQGVLDRRAEGVADRPRAGACRPRRASVATARRRSFCSTRLRPIWTRCAGPRCSTRSSRWAARRG